MGIDDPNDQLDVYVTVGEPRVTDSDEPLPPGLREFGRKAWIEAELLDAGTGTVLYAVVDRATDVIPHPQPIRTWADLNRAFVAWGNQIADRLSEIRRQQP